MEIRGAAAGAGGAAAIFQVNVPRMKGFVPRLLGALALAALVLWWLVDDRRGVRWAIRFVASRFPDVTHLSIGELAAWLENPKRPVPLLLDVRSEEEFVVSHLPKARRLDPHTPLDERALRHLNLEHPVVVYCSAGYRSARMARRLRRAGVKSVLNLAGGIFAWSNAGLPIEAAGEPAREVHPYLPVFSRMVAPRS